MTPGKRTPVVPYTHRHWENPLMNHQSLTSTARKEVEALGYLTSQTAMALRSSGVDPAAFERRVLDSAI